MRSLLCCTWLCACCAAPAADRPGFVTRQGAKLMLDGREYRAVGVNVPHLHQIHNGTWFHLREKYGTPERARAVALEAIEDCARNGLAFIRFFASPGYPRDAAQLYEPDPAGYWRQMDELFAFCRARHVRLIPSLQTIPGPFQTFGETGRAILDPRSRTWAWVRRYVEQFVTRYRDDPTVLLWELVNEGMLHADVEMQGRKLLPKGVFPAGAEPRVDGTNDDSLHFGDYQRLYREHAALIKSLDPNHLVTSGDAQVRPECTSRRGTFPNFRFRSDTWDEWVANNLAAQPEPLDVFSYHFYGADPPAERNVPWKGKTTLETMRELFAATQRNGRPIFVGELGASPNNRADPAGKWLVKCLDALEGEGVALFALWVWHFTWQPEFTMTSTTYPAVVKRAGEFNRKHIPEQLAP
jgi:hypothetical protein